MPSPAGWISPQRTCAKDRLRHAMHVDSLPQLQLSCRPGLDGSTCHASEIDLMTSQLAAGRGGEPRGLAAACGERFLLHDRVLSRCMFYRASRLGALFPCRILGS